MKLKNLIIFAITAILASCDAEYQTIDNRVYIAEAQSSRSKTITVEDNGVASSILVRSAITMDRDVVCEVEVDNALIDAYNKANQTSYLPLPAKFFELGQSTVTIPKGKTSAQPIPITIKPYDATLLPSEKYAVAVRLKSADGAEILNASRTLIFILNKAIFVTAFKNVTFPDYSLPDNKVIKDMSSWTVEFMNKLTSFSNNKHILSFSNKNDDFEQNQFFMRYGEFSHPTNEIQVKIGEYYYGPTLFDVNKWHHVAIVFEGNSAKVYNNGKLDLSFDPNMAGKKWSWTNLWIKIQNPGQTAEFRIWSKARNAAEIANNMYAVNPAAEGLEVYWKGDGSGKTITDHSGNERHLVHTANITFYPGLKFPEE